jgi:hypothetical protein
MATPAPSLLPPCLFYNGRGRGKLVPSPSPLPPSSSTTGEKGGWVAPSHEMVAQVRYVPNEKAEFLITLCDNRNQMHSKLTVVVLCNNKAVMPVAVTGIFVYFIQNKR